MSEPCRWGASREQPLSAKSWSKGHGWSAYPLKIDACTASSARQSRTILQLDPVISHP